MASLEELKKILKEKSIIYKKKVICKFCNIDISHRVNNETKRCPYCSSIIKK